MKAAFGWDDSAVLGVQPDAVQAPVVAPPPATVNGTSGNDFIHVSGDGLTAPQGYTDLPDATDGNDIINPMAGNDIVHAGGGNDDINMQSYLTAADQIDGGDGTLDTVVLNGDYSAGVVFNASTMQNVELLDLTQGFSYKLILANGNLEVAGGGEFDLFAGTSVSDSVYIDDSAETNANVLYQGSPGNDTFKAGGGQAYFQLQNGGNDTAIGGSGENTFYMGAALNAGDTLVGGSKFSQVVLDGDYSQGLVLGTSTITDMGSISFTAGHSYSVTVNDGNVAAGAMLYIYANQLGASDGFTFNGAAEMDGHFTILPGRGADSVTGGAGDDVIEYDGGIALKAADHVNGGAGNDMLVLTSDYSAGFTFGAATMVNVETLNLLADNSYKFTMNDANVGAGQTLTVDASALSFGNHLTFFGQAETNGSYDVIGGADSDTIFTGAGNDQIDLSKGGDDVANGEGGDDVFIMGAAMTASDQIDGGSGNDTLILNGTYSNLVFAQLTIQNIEKIVLAATHGYSLTMNDGNLSTGQTLTVDASALTSHFALTFDGRQETTASFAVIGGQGNDTIYGGGGNDSFDLSLGGNDTASGGGGNDTFVLGAALNAADAIDGGTGTDTVVLDGDYSAGLVFQAATMVNVERLILTKTHSYTLTMNDATVATGQTLTVENGSALGSHDVLTFDGSAETDGFYIVKGGAADDMFLMGGALKAQDTIDGGAGKDTLVLDGDYSGGLVFAASTMTNIETLILSKGHSYDLVLSDGNVAAGATLTVDASKLLGGDGLIFDGSAEFDGSYVVRGGKGDDHIVGGAGNDKLLGGKGNDVLQGGGGADLLDGGKGDNTYVYTAVGQSTSAGFDTIDGFNTKHDKIDLWFTVAGIDPTVAHGALSLATFDSDLAAAVGAGDLAADHAVLFTPDSGGFAGDTFLIVDVNGMAGYQAGQDLVIELDNAAKLDHLKVANFI